MATQKEIIEIEVTGINDAVKDISKVDNALKGVDDEIDNISHSSESLGKNLKKVDKGGQDAGKGLKAVGDNGGAIAVLDSLTGGLATKVRDTAEATKLFNFSLKGTKTALIATGIGAFVVALGLAVAYWDDIVNFITGANKQLQKQIDLNNENLEALDFELKLLDEKLKILELEGKSTEEIKILKEQTILLQQEQNALLLDKLKIQLETEQAQIKEVTLWEEIKIAATGALLGAEERAKALAKALIGDEEDKTRLKEIQTQIDEATLRTFTLKKALLELNKPEDVDPETGEKREKVTSVSQIEEAIVTAEGLEQVQIDSNFRKLNEANKFKLSKLRVEKDITAQEEQEQQQRLANAAIVEKAKLQLTAQTFGAIADILGTNSKAGKAAAIAQATINTYQGITEVWSSKSTLPEPFATISKIASTATVLGSGLKAVRSIKSQKLPALGGTGTANISSASAPALPATPQALSPSFNISDSTGVNQLAQSIGGQAQRPVRTFVVASDVTSAQSLDRNIISGASIG